MVHVRQFEAPDGAEIMGVGVIGVFDTLTQNQIDPILAAHGLNMADIDQESWYPLQVYWDLWRVIHDSPGGSQSLVAIGKSIAQNVTNPDEIGSVDVFITQVLNQTATGLIRNVPDGYGYIIEKVDSQHYEVTNNTGSSNDLVFGYIWESVRMLANGRDFTVAPIAGYAPDSDEGATFSVSWR